MKLRQLTESLNKKYLKNLNEKYSLVGQDGNAFSLMGYTARCMKECGLRSEINQMREEATSGDYYNLVRVCDEYIQKCNEINSEDEFLDEEIKRYSDVVPKEQRKYWYFTTHGVQPGSIPKDLNVLEIRDGKNDKGTNGTFVCLDGVLNTSELRDYDMKEQSPGDIDESLTESYNSFNWHGQVRIGVHDNDPKWPDEYVCQVNEIHPYDDAEYAWAKKVSPVSAKIIQNGKVIETISVPEWDDEVFEDENEYYNEVIDVMVRAIRKINKDVEPIMVHN